MACATSYKVPNPATPRARTGRIRTLQFTPVTPMPSLPTAPIVPATCRPWAPSSSGAKHVPVLSSEYDAGIVGSGSGPSPSAALLIMPPEHRGTESAALTKPYPSAVRFAAIAARCAVSATRILAARIAGETPTTAAPAGTAVARCDRIAPAHVRAPAVVASAADPTRGAPSAVCRKVTIRSFAVAACCDAGVARNLRRLTSFGRANDGPLAPTTA